MVVRLSGSFDHELFASWEFRATHWFYYQLLLTLLACVASGGGRSGPRDSGTFFYIHDFHTAMRDEWECRNEFRWLRPCIRSYGEVPRFC